MTMLIGLGRVTKQLESPQDIVTHHQWTCDENGHLMAPDARCHGILRRHDGLLNKRNVCILLLGPPSATKKALDSILTNTYRSYMILRTGICRASLSRMISCLSMSPSS
jgi:hypothetical protein